MLIIIFIFIIIASNLILFYNSNNKTISVINLIFIISILFVILSRKNGERYSYENDPNSYNYDEENPNALVTGVNISGTVYSSYPYSTPGLGWIL